MIRKIRAIASKLKFILGFTPTITSRTQGDTEWFIPEKFKSICLISADFEMAWASRYTKSVSNPLEKAIDDGYKTRENVPKILDLCDKYNIPITWATVGHLFLESCNEENGIKHPDLPRLEYFENQYWEFKQGDWFDYDPCTDFKRDPAWYAPDLIKDILSRKVKHEIGCHTFSHVDCRDSVDDGKVFEAEIGKCLNIAEEWNLRLRSFVHPGHTIGNLNTLSRLGFSSFRTDYGDTLGLPKHHFNGLWEFENTTGLAWRKEWSARYHIKRYKKIIDRAMKHNRLCVLWFHPSFNTNFVEEVFKYVLAYLDDKRDEILTTTHSEYAAWLNKQNENN